jgi:tetratricopeptide (TPR) repeat protein
MKRSAIQPLFACLLLGLAACQTEPEVVIYAGQPAPEPEPVAPAIDQAQVARARQLADMLYQAKVALDANRLMLPAGNNAYEIYQQVFQLDPGNAVAVQGMADIVLRYVALASDATNKGEYDNAAGYLNRAARLDANSSAVATARARLAEARKKQVDMIVLEPDALKSKSLELMGKLADIAQQIKANNSTFMIRARNDEEGRWIYKTMRDAVGGERLHGNIDISGTPGIVITSATTTDQTRLFD